VTDTGIDLLDESAAARLLPERAPRSHKGTFGRVVAVAGSLDYAGAALMAGAAALRAGSGLVTLCVPLSLQPVIAGRVPELITLGLPETAPHEVDPVRAAAALAELPADALLVGPGLPATRANRRLVAAVLRAEGAPALVDAGALTALADAPGWWDRLGRLTIVTPHPGEFARLGRDAGDSDETRRAAAIAAATDWGVIVVLKGAHTVIAGPDGRGLSTDLEVPALATAGSGDVLAGVIASYVGQGLEPFEASALGVYVHGLAGQWLGERFADSGVIATDLLTTIPRARRYLLDGRDRGPLGFGSPSEAEA
jgi:NAD(P)H-hydrate epimerase